jgi:hypothetical protein
MLVVTDLCDSPRADQSLILSRGLQDTYKCGVYYRNLGAVDIMLGLITFRSTWGSAQRPGKSKHVNLHPTSTRHNSTNIATMDRSTLSRRHRKVQAPKAEQAIQPAISQPTSRGGACSILIRLTERGLPPTIEMILR